MLPASRPAALIPSGLRSREGRRCPVPSAALPVNRPPPPRPHPPQHSRPLILPQRLGGLPPRLAGQPPLPAGTVPTGSATEPQFQPHPLNPARPDTPPAAAPGQRGLCMESPFKPRRNLPPRGGEGEGGRKVVPRHPPPGAEFTAGRRTPLPSPPRAGPGREAALRRGRANPPLSPPPPSSAPARPSEERYRWAERSRSPHTYGPAIRLHLTQQTEAPGRRDGQEAPSNEQAGWPPKM